METTTQNPKTVIVEYNGQELPFLNNLTATRNLCNDVGITSLSGIEDALAAARNNPDEMSSLELLAKNFYYAFKEGHRVEGKGFTMQLDDMLDVELTQAITAAIHKKFGDTKYASTEEQNTNKQTDPNEQTQPS